MGTSRKLHFSTHAELKNVIGQDLINDDNIAVIELVKNGIDAGAKRITLTFLESPLPGSSMEAPAILIEDDGSGMTEDDVEHKWLNIAYSEKKAQQQAGGRLLAGNKGVGRFACDRLGTQLDMYTRRRGKPLLHLKVDWTAFENKQQIADTIQKVSVVQRTVKPASVQQHVGRSMPAKGTMLVVTRLRQTWGRDKLLHLKRTLQRFVNPIAALDREGVEIQLSVPHELSQDLEEEPHDRLNGVVENQVFEHLKFKTTYIEAKLDAKGERLTTELFHEGQRIYRLVEERTDFKPLKGVSVTLHYMNSYKKAYFKRQTGLHLVDFGSVFLFINGYRVPPYGDRDNDWLQLDNRKGQGTGRFLGTREVLGIISIDDPGKTFRIVSNREGLVRDGAFIALISRRGGFFFAAAISRLERFVVDGLNWDTVPLHLREQLNAGIVPGESDMPGEEVYNESHDLKRRRIALDVLKIVGASPATTKELEIDPDILDALAQERAQDVQAILDKFGSFDTSVGHDVRLALGRVQKEFERQRAELSKAQKEASRKDRQVQRLKSVARGISEKNVSLERQIKTQQTEILFSRVASGSDQDQLMLLHHQSGIYAMTARNFLEKGLAQLRQGDVGKAQEALERALNSTRKVITVSKFATKANFRLKTETITADIVTFIKEYLMNVAKDTSAQNLALSVTADSDEPFQMRFKPIDVAIVFDNVASNSTRAKAKKLSVHMARPAANELLITISDNGPGVSPEIQPPQKVFDRGVTTTVNGSGLGLYHVRETIKQMGGDIQLAEGPGFTLVIRLFK